MMKKVFAVIGVMVCAVALVVGVVYGGLALRWWGNTVDYEANKIDEATRYDLLREVENTCRAMVSSYEADVLTYEQYKDSDSSEKQSWAEQARMRANKTASTYNNYILKNSYLWQDNVPEDIRAELPTF